MKNFLFVLAMLCVLNPLETLAFTTVTGHCGSGPIMGVAEYTKLTGKLNKLSSDIKDLGDIILQVGKANQATEKEGQASLEKQNEFLVKSLRDIVVKSAITQEMAYNERWRGEGSQVRGVCEENELATHVRQAIEAVEKVKTGLIKQSEEYSMNVATPSEAIARKVGVKTESVFFHPEGGYLTDTQLKEMTTGINVLIDPTPILPLTEAQKNTPVGSYYIAEKNLSELKLKEVRNVFFGAQSKLATKLTGSPVEAVNKLNELYGTAGTPLQVQNNEISLAGLLEFESKLRIGSQNWENDVNSKGEAFLLKDQTRMQAMQLRLQYESYKLLESISILLAQTVSDRVSKDKNAATNYYLGQMANK